jgi:hypothetical protein
LGSVIFNVSQISMRLLLSLVLVVLLAGCYTVNQQRFAEYVAETVQPGMSLAQATERLSVAGFACDPRSASPAITCTRTRQSVLPYTCIERINLMPNTEITSVIAIAVAPIVCAGF